MPRPVRRAPHVSATRPIVGSVLLAAAVPWAGAVSAQDPPPVPGPFAIMAAVDSAATLDLWPEFDPRHVPVAIYDGEWTYLFRHAAPPPGFFEVPDLAAVRVFAGRHPAMGSNTWVALGDVPTATVVVESAGSSAHEFAALVVHEAFHAFQAPRHPDWTGNEAELFVYPVNDVELLTLRRLESDALRRALAVRNLGRAACWAQVALEWRAQRFRLLAPGAVGYERRTELHEGLAQYVQSRALRMRYGRGIPFGGFPPDAVRTRAYASGEVLALLLDRFDDEWKRKLEAGLAASLDELLSDRLRSYARGSCGYSRRQRAAVRAQARRDVAALGEQWAAWRRDFLAQSGWTVVVIAEGSEPLWPQAFDPLNAAVVGAGEVLHTRWLRLGNDAGTLEVRDRVALTTAAGSHPLFDGVWEVVVRGFEAEPAAGDTDGALVIEVPGFAARFRTAVVERHDSTITVRLGQGRP